MPSYVRPGIRKCAKNRALSVTNNLADGDLLVVTGKKHGNGKILILKLVRHEYNSSFWAGLQDMPIIVTNGD